MSRRREVSADEARGGWINSTAVDCSFPVETVHQIIASYGITIGLAGFDEFFGLHLGCYRTLHASVSSMPSVMMELNLVTELKNAIDQVRIRIANLPPRTSGIVSKACSNRSDKTDIVSTLPVRIEADLKEMHVLLLTAENELKPYAGRAGRKHVFTRDFLLRDVAVKLLDMGPLTKRMAAECARDILRACRVFVPDDSTEVARIIRKWTKGEK
jgi:hypothetical protein